MHGSIFVLLQRFVEDRFDHKTWLQLLADSAIARKAYELNGVYPDEEIQAIIAHAAKLTGLSPVQLHEKFGEFLVPDLLKVYHKYIDPSWTTMEMLEHTETTMHKAARIENAETTPPVLHVNRVNPGLIIIDYYSKRKMGGLAIGIIRGIAAYYHETGQIQITPTSELDAERVQIRVEKLDKPENGTEPA